MTPDRKRADQPGSSAGRLLAFFFDNSLLLVIGAVAALIWANADLARAARTKAFKGRNRGRG